MGDIDRIFGLPIIVNGALDRQPVIASGVPVNFGEYFQSELRVVCHDVDGSSAIVMTCSYSHDRELANVRFSDGNGETRERSFTRQYLAQQRRRGPAIRDVAIASGMDRSTVNPVVYDSADDVEKHKPQPKKKMSDLMIAWYS